MLSRARHCAVHLALVAMILRAFVPAGWMPDLAGNAGSALILCSMDGATQIADRHSPAQPAPGDADHGHEACPFAAAPSIATPPGIATLALPAGFALATHPPQGPPAAVTGEVYQPQSPRAPPLKV